MQKKLIALAVAGLASSAAFAQSNVTIYGLLQPSYDFMTIKSSSAADGKFTDQSWNNSRLGFKGEEALGNGMKAIFQIENKVDISNRGDGSGGLGSRDSWVGIAGGFGSVTVGNHQTSYVRVSAAYDKFADSIGDYNNIMGVYGNDGGGSSFVSDGASVEFNRRVNKSIYYTSPTISGFQGTVSYGLKDALEDTKGTVNKTDSSILSAALAYTNGGLNVFGAYEHQNQKTDGTAGNDKDKAYKFGASYKFGFGTTLAGIYEKMKSNDNYDVKHYYIAASHPITSNVDLLASYIKASDDKENGAGVNSAASNWNLGVDYKLSKRTSVQGVYTRLSNKADGDYFIDSNAVGSNGGTGYKVSGFSVRVKHAF